MIFLSRIVKLLTRDNHKTLSFSEIKKIILKMGKNHNMSYFGYKEEF